MKADRAPGRIARLVSGGQTGVDRAALDAALALGIPCGGWCPAAMAAEDGVIDRRYGLRPTPGAAPAQRTRWNVRDADGTLIIAREPLRGGTALTRQAAVHMGKPHLVVDPGRGSDPSTIAAIGDWLAGARIRVLNVAGPRESECPGIYGLARALLLAALA